MNFYTELTQKIDVMDLGQALRILHIGKVLVEETDIGCFDEYNQLVSRYENIDKDDDYEVQEFILEVNAFTAKTVEYISNNFGTMVEKCRVARDEITDLVGRIACKYGPETPIIQGMMNMPAADNIINVWATLETYNDAIAKLQAFLVMSDIFDDFHGYGKKKQDGKEATGNVIRMFGSKELH